jgi:putative membrane protein insertion efficiency factor
MCTQRTFSTDATRLTQVMSPITETVRKVARIIYRLPRSGLIGLVRAYRLLLSPWLGSSCRFEPTCSAYSLLALEEHGAALGSALTAYRLVRCHPWCAGGLDPVPQHFKIFTFQSADDHGVKPGRTGFLSRLVTPVTVSPSKKKPS